MFKSSKQYIIKMYIIIILAIFVIITLPKRKISEGFNNLDILNAVSLQNNLFNSVFSKIDNKEVEISKNLKINNINSENLDSKNINISNELLLNNEIKKSGLKITNKYSGYSDKVEKHSEISNDTEQYKALMIVGNKSNKDKIRTVNVYDKLNVGNGSNGQFCIDGVCIKKEHLEILTGKKPFFIRSHRNNQFLQNGNLSDKVKGSNHNHNLNSVAQFRGGKGDWEKLYIVM